MPIQKLVISFVMFVALASVAHADGVDNKTFDITGSSDTVKCAELAITCNPMTFNMVVNTTSEFNSQFGFVNEIVSLGGTLNGLAMTGTGGFLVPGFAERPLGSSTDFSLSNGQQGFFGFDDLITLSVIFNYGNSLDDITARSLVTWNATQVPPVSTPEPSVLLMLLAGLGACAVLRRLA